MSEQKSSTLDELDEKEVGLIGFCCPRDGQNRKFNYCFKECENKCEPLPILIAMSSKRKVVKNKYSTTEILNPPQLIYLQRHFPYFVPPKNRTFVTFGTGWHTTIEKSKYKIEELGLKDDYILENNGKSFEVEIPTTEGTAILTGRPDLYIIPEKHLWDFKTMKYYYDVKNQLEGKGWAKSHYPWQVNIYRRYCYPETVKMTVEALVKDFKRNMKAQGVEPVMQFDVPFIKDEMIEEFVKTKLAYLLYIEKNPEKCRMCSTEEMWVSYNKRSPDYMKSIRCPDYCDVNGICPQYNIKGNTPIEIPTKAEDIL